MGFFSNLFGGSPDIERQLEDIYVPMFVTGRGMSQSEARNMVRDLIQQAKEDAEKEETTKIPPNFGDILIDSEDKEQQIKTMLRKRRKEGVKDEDIRWWWNMHDLERRLLAKDDEVSRMASFINSLQEGKSKEQAAALVKKYFPIFGDPDDTGASSGDDRPLPYELKDRINIYIQHRATDNAVKYKKDIESSSSFNALVRREIKGGRLGPVESYIGMAPHEETTPSPLLTKNIIRSDDVVCNNCGGRNQKDNKDCVLCGRPI